MSCTVMLVDMIVHLPRYGRLNDMAFHSFRFELPVHCGFNPLSQASPRIARFLGSGVAARRGDRLGAPPEDRHDDMAVPWRNP